MWSKVAILLEVLALSQDWGKVEGMPKAVKEVLHKIREFLKKWSDCMVVGIVGQLFLIVLRKAIVRRMHSCKKHKKS